MIQQRKCVYFHMLNSWNIHSIKIHKPNMAAIISEIRIRRVLYKYINGGMFDSFFIKRFQRDYALNLENNNKTSIYNPALLEFLQIM